MRRINSINKGRGPSLRAPWLIGGAAVALLGMAIPQTARADCLGATPALQAAVCPNAPLVAGWAEIDAKLAEMTSALPDLSSALEDDQVLFVARLDRTLADLLAEQEAQEIPSLLLTALEDRLAFLNAIEPTAETGLLGLWQNAVGAFTVRPSATGTFAVQLSILDPIMGLHTCSVEGEGQQSADLLTLPLAPSDEVSFARVGQSALVGVDYTRAGRSASGPLQCSESAPLTGWYFRVKEEA